MPTLLIGLIGGGLPLLGLVTPGAPDVAGAVLSARAVTASVLEAEKVPPVPAQPLEEARAEARASRDRRTAVTSVPEPEPAPIKGVPVPAPVPEPAAPVPAPPPPPPAPLPGCDAAAGDTHDSANGRLPDRVLCGIPGSGGEQLRADAAIAFARLAAGYQEERGEPICLTDGYRTIGEQRQLRRTKPRLAARPGTSEHGWGLAVDLACGIQSFRSSEHAWMVENADRYGWFLPAWAKRGGAKPEPWHWEYDGS